MGKHHEEMHAAWKRQHSKAETWSKNRALAEPLHREQEDLQTKWLRRDTLMLEDVKIFCMRVCPGDVKKHFSVMSREVLESMDCGPNGVFWKRKKELCDKMQKYERIALDRASQSTP